MAPDWVNDLALPATTQTASFTVTMAMVGPTVLTVPYSSAAAGTATIPGGLTTVLGADILFGQVGAGALTIAGSGGATVVGQLVTLGPNHVLKAVQTALNVWTVRTHSWNLPQFLGNPNSQPFLVSYGRINFFNGSGASVLIDTNPNLVFGGNGILLVASGTGSTVNINTFSKDYGNAPSELWYGIVATTTSNLTVTTGPSISSS